MSSDDPRRPLNEYSPTAAYAVCCTVKQHSEIRIHRRLRRLRLRGKEGVS